jgi:sugar phosphate permease
MKARIQGSQSYAWLVVLLLWLVCLINYADRQAIFSVFNLLKSDLGLSDVQLGVLGSCFMWVYALTGPVAGWITDRVSRTCVIVCALSFWSLMTGATMWAHTACAARSGGAG